jgi:hypothetical protein
MMMMNFNEPDSKYLGFAWNKTCAEVDCGQYGACCSARRMIYGIRWWCAAGCHDPERIYSGAEFVQGYTCPSTYTGCDNHTGACCYMKSMGPSGVVRSCADGVRRKACSNRPSYVGFHLNATCESINNCNTTLLGACLSLPVLWVAKPGNWPCIAGYSEAMCFSQSFHPNWFPQHAPGHSCKGSDTKMSSNNTNLRQRGACWSFNATTGARQCNNNMMRRVCMA